MSLEKEASKEASLADSFRVVPTEVMRENLERLHQGGSLGAAKDWGAESARNAAAAVLFSAADTVWSKGKPPAECTADKIIRNVLSLIADVKASFLYETRFLPEPKRPAAREKARSADLCYYYELVRVVREKLKLHPIQLSDPKLRALWCYHLDADDRGVIGPEALLKIIEHGVPAGLAVLVGSE